MKKYIAPLVFILFTLIILFSFFTCMKKNPEITVENLPEKVQEPNDYELITKTVQYEFHNKNYQSFVAYNSDTLNSKPVVFIIPEWWGLNDYAKYRAKKVAELGYLAFAIDYYGDGKVADNPTDAEKLASPFYQSSSLGKIPFEAARAQIANFSFANTNNEAVIGYCFGGAQALNMGRQFNDLKAAVSFHGNLMTGVKPNNNSAKYLILNGEADTFISKEEIAAFKKEMDSAKIVYNFIDYPGAKHAFTNPNATEIGEKFGLGIAYNQKADEDSWTKMTTFLKEVF